LYILKEQKGGQTKAVLFVYIEGTARTNYGGLFGYIEGTERTN